jgi:antirestriction protein ArdC
LKEHDNYNPSNLSSAKMSNPRQIREEITAKIIAALEKDLLPWRRPWASNNAGQHSNALTKKSYRGVNPLLLQLHAAEHDFSSNWWATFNQWKQLGCSVNRRPDHVEAGHWGATLAVYIPVTKKAEEPADDDEDEEETFWILKKFVVFNADQVNGANAEQFQAVETVGDVHPDYEPAEELIEKTGAEIHFGGDRAFYRPPVGTWPNHHDGDFIQVPHKSSFVNGSFYPTILHELGHWSEVRVGWDREKGGYAMGELIAEIASCYLASELGVPNGEPLDNHAAYLKSWLEGMHGDPNYIFKASRQASKVCDFLLSFVRQAETESVKNEMVEAA